MAYTDAFTEAGTTNLEDHGSNWVSVTGAAGELIISSQLVGNANGAGYYYNQTFATTHYAKAKYVDGGSGSYNGPAVRVQTSSGNPYYYQLLAGNNVYPGENIGGSLADWGTETALSANDIFELQCQAAATTTVKYRVNGSDVTTYSAPTVTSLPGAGRAGVACYGGGTIDDWEGGDVSTGGTRTVESVTGALKWLRTRTVPGVTAALKWTRSRTVQSITAALRFRRTRTVQSVVAAIRRAGLTRTVQAVTAALSLVGVNVRTVQNVVVTLKWSRVRSVQTITASLARGTSRLVQSVTAALAILPYTSVERKTGAGGSYAEIAKIYPPDTTYDDPGPFVSGTTYYYRARTCDQWGAFGDYSAEVSVTWWALLVESITAALLWRASRTVQNVTAALALGGTATRTVQAVTAALRQGFSRSVQSVSAVLASRIGRPEATVSSGNWTTAPLWSKVDEP